VIKENLPALTHITGNYTPPSCQFNRVVMNFTVTSRGRQFDRLALMYFGDTEVWRTSTAEPTQSGIEWTYMKDMSEYLYFWKEPQKIIFDLGNLIDSTYTGFFNTTLTATFFIGPDVVDPASLIIPISARQSTSDSASVFLLPADTASNTIAFPRNANRAVFSVSACGQATEEFWWSNVLQSNVDTFLPADGVLYGFSPWREVQVLIDGHLAGVHWPFPIIFTGGVVPGLWRPIVGIDAFDLREHEIDITPWLPVLSDGEQHTFEIKVAGIDDDGGTTGTVTETVGNFWYVTGKIFVWLDDPSSITTGTAPTLTLPQPGIMLSQSYTQIATGVNQTLNYKTSVTRSLSISSIVKTQNGLSPVTWTQSLSYTNLGIYTNQGYTQWNSLTTTGMDTSAAKSSPYSTTYKYPLTANTTFWTDPSGSGNFSLTATIDRGLSIEVIGKSIFPESYPSFSTNPSAGPSNSGNFSSSYLHTTQDGSAYYFASPSTQTGLSFGTTQQDFVFGGVEASTGRTEEYTRSVESVNSTIVYDRETLVGTVVSTYQSPIKGGAGGDQAPIGPIKSPKAAIGRGPGESKAPLVMSGHSR
jgi:Peptide N-acetyl-beta-D-glucosaminyl asparaginase amidase A